MNRRLIRRALACSLLVVILAGKAAQDLATASPARSMTSRVAVIKAHGNPQAAVRRAVAESGGLTGVISPGDVVVVKPNLVLDAAPGSGIVTDPAVAREVVRLAREAGAGQVIIGEGTAQYGGGDPNRDRFCTQSAFRAAGFDTNGDMKDDATGAPLVNLNDSGGTDVRDPTKVAKVVVPAGLMRTEYWLPRVILEADVLISVPVLKNHYNAGVTLGMKNLVGLLPNDLYHGPGNIYGKNSLSHNPIELDRHIVDINLARRPDFVVVDGQRGMLDGPVGSQVANPAMDLILAGPDVVAVDTIGTLIMGYDPAAVSYINLAAQSGLGAANPAHIDVRGIPVSEARRDFPAPYAGSAGQRADAQPPHAVIKEPRREELTGDLVVEVEASDNDVVARVEFYLDDAGVGEALSPPYQVSLKPAKQSPGNHLVRAVVYDRCLNRSETTQTISFQQSAPTNTPAPQDTATQSSPTPSDVPTATPTSLSTRATPTATQHRPTATATPTATQPRSMATATPTPMATATATATSTATATDVAKSLASDAPSPSPTTVPATHTPQETSESSPTALTPPAIPSSSVPAFPISHAVVLLGVGGIGTLVIGLMIWRRRRE